MIARRRSILARAAVVFALVMAGAPGVAAPPALADARAASEAIAHVQYLSGASVYVDAGSRDGLREGDSLAVVRGGAVVARLRASFLSSRRAACDTLVVSSEIRLGDEVRFRPHADARETEANARAPSAAAPLAPDSVAASPAAVTTASPSRPTSRRRGRIGARFIGHHETTSGVDYTQPAADLRLDAFNVARGRMDFAADVRSRRTTQTLADGVTATDAATRAYRVSVTVHDRAARNRLTVGRQSSPALGGISLFDGALAERTGPRWGAGLFSGTQPEPLTLGFSNAILQHGAYVELRQRPLSTRRWTLTTGFITSTQDGTLNRNFAFLQGLYFDPRWFVSLAQEVDVNGGWKRALGEPVLSPTSTFLTTRARVGEALTLRAGYDNRRNVRLYRDRETPETQFDDGYRQGGWSGASLELLKHLRLDFEGRLNRREGDNAHTLSGSAEVFRVTRLQLVSRLRASSFASRRTESRLMSFGLGIDPTTESHVEVTGGVRTTTDRTTGERERAPWQDVDLDLSLWRRWYLSGSLELDQNAGIHSRQEYVGLSWRF